MRPRMIPAFLPRDLIVLRKILLVLVLFASTALMTFYLHNRSREQITANAPLAVIQSYLKATYARDYRTAYAHLSRPDRTVRDEKSYVAGQVEYTGFTARLAGMLAGFMDLKLTEESSDGPRTKIKVEYSVPAPEDVSSLVWDWNAEKLNSLSTAEQARLLDAVAARQRIGNLTRIQGHQTFELIREGNGWKIFQDWGAGTRVKVHTILAGRSDVEIKLLQNEIITSGQEPFQVNLAIKNRGSQPVVLAMRHVIEPFQAADYLEMIQCGLERAVVVEPGTQKEFSMAYLLDPTVRNNFQDLALTYAFEAKQ
jgi:cytochrome c oxidase assembly protein CtaG/Cox11